MEAQRKRKDSALTLLHQRLVTYSRRADLKGGSWGLIVARYGRISISQLRIGPNAGQPHKGQLPGLAPNAASAPARGKGEAMDVFVTPSMQHPLLLPAQGSQHAAEDPREAAWQKVRRDLGVSASNGRIRTNSLQRRPTGGENSKGLRQRSNAISTEEEDAFARAPSLERTGTSISGGSNCPTTVGGFARRPRLRPHRPKEEVAEEAEL